ncbi:hypothetical protein BSL78_22441 [Apostichopus japonicus]|uniref:Uncharacterized protein n=1 Tax=Stichopus japonicus TaxID=307972 RepID=A0A2G8JY40_STIJA|nr:hypothetical protein BSL78_22441 [Apostichopus japonicus]
MANGQPLGYDGFATFSLIIKEKLVQYEVWVADIETEGILGIDFLRDYNCQIEAGSGKVTIGEQTSVNVEQVEVSCCRIRIAENVMIPPGCEAVVPGSLEKKSNGIAVVEMLPRFLEKHGMMVARAVVDASMSVYPSKSAEPTDQHKTIYEGTKLPPVNLPRRSPVE